MKEGDKVNQVYTEAMERYYSQFIGSEIVSEGGGRAGYLYDIVVNPETGKVEGFLLGPQGKKVIAAHDMFFGNQQLLIRDMDNILDIHDIIKVNNILHSQITIFKNKVVTKKGHYLGHVMDYSIHTQFLVVTKILVAKTFMRLFPYDEKSISFKDILEIRQDRIIVKNPLRLTPVRESKTAEMKPKLHIDVAPTG